MELQTKKIQDLQDQVDLLTEQKWARDQVIIKKNKEIQDLKDLRVFDHKDALEVANKLRAEIARLNKVNYQSHKKALKYKWESEMREGKFISSQKVVFELRKHLEDVQEQLSSVTIK